MCILMNTEVCETFNLIAMCILVNTGMFLIMELDMELDIQGVRNRSSGPEVL